MSFETVVQTAIYNELIGDRALSLEITNVYDDVPQANESGNALAFPYVTIGEDVFTDISTDLELMSQVIISL